MTPETWNEQRLTELEELEQLLIECGHIDSGSGIINRLQRITEVANKLRRSDYQAQPFRRSFLSFLRDEAWKRFEDSKEEGTA
jgi:hypothetical protein